MSVFSQVQLRGACQGQVVRNRPSDGRKESLVSRVKQKSLKRQTQNGVSGQHIDDDL